MFRITVPGIVAGIGSDQVIRRAHDHEIHFCFIALEAKADLFSVLVISVAVPAERTIRVLGNKTIAPASMCVGLGMAFEAHNH